MKAAQALNEAATWPFTAQATPSTNIQGPKRRRMASRFWQRYRSHPLLAEIADRAAYFTKAVAAIYIVRENLVEFTVVRTGALCWGWRRQRQPPRSTADRCHC